MARPIRLSMRLRASQNMTTATTSTTRYIHWSGVTGNPNGASGLIRLMPCTPFVKPSKCLYLRICGTAIASANVASAR